MKVFTVGYGLLTLDELLHLLSQHGITHVLDVRSENDGEGSVFSDEDLRMGLIRRGIRYAPMRESLGAPCNADPAEYERIAQSEDYRAGMQRLMQAIMDPDRLVCLLGTSVEPENCHRAKLIGAALSKGRTEVLHIEPEALLTQAQAMERLTAPQH